MSNSLISGLLAVVLVGTLAVSSSVSMGGSYLDFRVTDRSEADFTDGTSSIQEFGDSAVFLTSANRSFNHGDTGSDSSRSLTTVQNTLFAATMVEEGEREDIRQYNIYRKDQSGLELMNTFNVSRSSGITSFSASGDGIAIGFRKVFPEDDGGLNWRPHMVLLDSQGYLQNSFELEETPDSVSRGLEDSVLMVSGEKVLKYSDDGSLIWERELGYPGIGGTEDPNFVIRVEGGEIFVGATVSNGEHSIALSKYSESGEQLWTAEKDYPGVNERLNSLKVSGNAVYISATALNPEPGYSRDSVLTKVSETDGTTLWSKTVDVERSSRERINKLSINPGGGVKMLTYSKTASELRGGLKTENKNILTVFDEDGKQQKYLKTRDKGLKQVFFASGRPYALDNSRIKALSEVSNPNSVQWDLDLPFGLLGTSEYYETDFYHEREEEIEAYVEKINRTALGLSTTGSGGETVLVIENNGDRTVNGSELDMMYNPSDYAGPVGHTVLKDKEYMIAENNCLKQGHSIEPGQQYRCETGLKHPVENMSIEILSQNLDYEKTVKIN